MLRFFRIFFALFFFLGITLLFLDLTGVLHHYLGWMAQVQLLPAILSLNVVAVAFVLLLTILFGRVYCSVICPLGVFQDVVARLGKPFFKHRYHFAQPRPWLRYGVLSLFVLLMLVGLNYIALLVAPYSAYGRMVATLLRPCYAWVNNLLAQWHVLADSFLFYKVDVLWRGGMALVVSLVTLLLIGLLAIRYGRLWCNTICPVGAVLGLVSRFSLFRMVLDTEKCRHCKQCERNCKSMCIDSSSGCIDASRCVSCMNCISACKFNALHFRWAFSKPSAKVGEFGQEGCPSDLPDTSRRRFLTTSALLAVGAATAASAKTVDGGLAAIADKKQPQRTIPIRPSGALSQRNFTSHCTSCMLCVSQCPQHLLHPSSKLSTLLQPEVDYSKGFCPVECTRCSQLCPTGAIRQIDVGQKTSISVGYAVVLLENCIANEDGVSCGTCARHCPASAIHMVKGPQDALIPTVDENRCLGCGACEYYCPSRPFSAIYIEGRDVHTRI